MRAPHNFPAVAPNRHTSITPSGHGTCMPQSTRKSTFPHFVSPALNPPPPVCPQLSVLQGENDKLHQLISELVKGNARAQSPGFTVINAGGDGRKGWSVLIIPVAVAGGVLYVYLRFRGWRVTDFM